MINPAKKNTLAAAIAALSMVSASAMAGTVTTNGPDLVINNEGGGFGVSTSDGSRTFNVHGLVVLNHSVFDKAYNNDNFGQKTQLQNARVGVDGKLADHWGYEIQLANADTDGVKVFVRHANISYMYSDAFNLTLGKQDLYWGDVNNMQSDRSNYGTNFTMLTQAFSPPVANGLQVNGYQQFGSQQGINWAVGIFNADTVQAPEDTIGSNKSLGDRAFYNGNLGVTLLNEPSQGNTVHASVTYTHYEQGGEAQPFGANGGVTGTGFNDGVGVLPVVNTGRFGGIGSAKQKSTNLYDLGALVQLGPLSAEAEYARYRGGVKGQDITREKLNYDGYYAQVGYVLTGEHRTFDPKEGYLKGVEKPDHSYGAWELIARYDSLDLKSNAGAGGARIGNRGRATTVGVNWYVNQNLSFALDATHLNLNGESKAKKSGNGAALKAVYTF